MRFLNDDGPAPALKCQYKMKVIAAGLPRQVFTLIAYDIPSEVDI
jgi:hypothetical protein